MAPLNNTEHESEESINKPRTLNKVNDPTLTLGQNIFTGFIMGGSEVAINHPLWSIKTLLQRGQNLTLNPLVLYRGVLVNMCSMVPITTIQVSLNYCFKNILFSQTDKISNNQKVMCAFAAGLSTAPLSCASEMIMTQQNKVGGNFFSVQKQLSWRRLMTGLPVIGLRESIYTSFFLAGTPALSKKLQPLCENSYVASLGAGIGTGVGATLATQLFDTIKTVQQANDKPINALDATKSIVKNYGLFGLFKGTLPRGLRVVSALYIMDVGRDKLEKNFNRVNLIKEIPESEEIVARCTS